MKRNVIALVGAGGIGSWVVFLAPPNTRIYVYDDDIVEGSNLNRVPFLLEHIGKPKVEALADLVRRYRLAPEVIPIKMRVSATTKLPEDVQMLVDVTDSLAVRKMLARLAKAHGIKYVGLGYDGFQVTIFDEKSVLQSYSFGPGGYTFTPSFVAPPVYLAAKFWKGELAPMSKQLG